MASSDKTITVFITAGEPSGDSLGAALMRALTEKHAGNVRFAGVGGEQMEAAGLKSIFPMVDLSVMGLLEVVPRLNRILKRIQQTADKVCELEPDIFITIDAPDFSTRVADKVHKQCKNKPLMAHYVAPTVWAWRPERAAKFAGLYDVLLCLFPFEPSYFEKEDIHAAFVGHSMLAHYDERRAAASRNAFRERHNIGSNDLVLGLLFGSRMGELNTTGPIVREAAVKMVRRLKADHKIHVVAPSLPHLRNQAQNLLERVGCPKHLILDGNDKWPSFYAMDAAIAVSGTVGLELSVAGVPHVIGYKMNPMTWQMIKRKVKVKYAHLSNILLDQAVVPEFIQNDCTAENLVQACEPLFTESAARDVQISANATIRQLLTPEGDVSASEKAAETLLTQYRGMRQKAA